MPRLLLALICAATLTSAAFAQDAAPPGEAGIAVHDRARPAVVGITCAAVANGRQVSYFGTGTIIHPDGLVLTSTTVVPAKAKDIAVMLANGERYPARLVLAREERELAVIDIDGEGYPFLPLGDSDEVQLGDAAFTVGNAYRITEVEGQVALCAGIISGMYALEANGDEESTYRGTVLETTAALNPGVDGGPLLDARGRIIGLLSLGFSPNRFLGTAVPINQIRVDLQGTRRIGGRLGLRGRRSGAGFIIDAVVAGGPAASAGLRPGDVITKVRGRALTEAPTAIADALEAGAELPLEVSRGPASRELTLRAGELTEGLGVAWPASELAAPDPVAAATARVLRRAVAAVSPSVVTIRTARRVSGRQTALENHGSGVIVSPNGEVLTSHFNIDGAELIRVRLSDGRELSARVLGSSPVMDLALLKVDAEGLPVAAFGERSDVPPGTPCAVIGRGLGAVTVTHGIISATGRQRGACYQLDAIMNLANTGGAIVNMRGEILGVGAFIGTREDWSWGLSSGVGFAVTTRKLFEVIDDLRVGRSGDAMPTLGVISKAGSLVIESVVAGSAAERAGIRAGDEIVAVDGRPLEGWGDLVKAVRLRIQGDTMRLTVRRGGESLTIEAKL